jgi:hypothetical protein
MMLSNDDVLLIIVISGALGIYACEMAFFWARWTRLSTQLSEDGGALGRVQVLEAEIDVLAGELQAMRRQLQRQAELFSGASTPMVSSVPLVVESRPPERAPSVPPKPPTRPHINQQKPLASRQSAAPSAVSTHASRSVDDRSMASRSMGVPASAKTSPVSGMPASHLNFSSKEPEVLHRRVIELAKSGLSTSAIATECQLSQTEAELILSLNGIKRA